MKTAFNLPQPLAWMTLCAFVLAVIPATAQSTEWRFTVRLDDRPIGTHRFLVESTGLHTLRVESEARFDVTLLRVPLYRYRHTATEYWSNECLVGIDARTDDNGHVTEVRGRAGDAGFAVHVTDDAHAAQEPVSKGACLMSFAYWNPALAAQERLLDPGTGRIETVHMRPSPAVAGDLQVSPERIRGLRVGGLAQPIDVWYAADGRWVGLDTLVDGGRHLSYRLN